jgi:ankyrin repeat protein
MSVDPRTQSLFDAIAATNYSQVKRAIDSGVSVNSQNACGQTPLAVACKQGNLEIVDLLVASGGKMQVQGSRGQELTDSRELDLVATTEIQSRVVPVLGDWDFQSILFETDSINAAELPESPVRDREIAYEDLIELIHQAPTEQPAEHDLVISIGGDRPQERLAERSATPSASTPTTGQRINSIVLDWQEATSDPEATYTFDLDEVFAANEKKSAPPVNLSQLESIGTDRMFDEEMTLTSLQQPMRGTESRSTSSERAQTTTDRPQTELPSYSEIFDEEMTMTSIEQPDLLDYRSVGVGVGEAFSSAKAFVSAEASASAERLRQPGSSGSNEWAAGTTYTFDLEADLNRLSIGNEVEPDRLTMRMDEWEEGETYAIDEMPDFGAVGEPTNPDLTAIGRTGAEAPLDLLQHSIDEGETYAIDLDDLVGEAYRNDNRSQIMLDLTANPNEADLPIDPINWEEGETYAIDLGDLDSSNRSDTSIDPSRLRGEHLLGDLDATCLPVIGGDDGADFDPDTQTSTDIFGRSQTATGDEPGDLNPVYDENETNTSLMAAIVAGDLDLASQAVEARASLDRYDWHLGFSPLGMAISRGYADLVRFLLDAGANPRTGSLTMTALGLAAEQGEAEIIQMLLPRGIDVNEPVGQDGWTALLSAIKYGHRSVVRLLVAAGANVNIWSRGETPILLAAKCEEREIYNYLYPLIGTALRLCADRDGEQLLQTTRKRRIRAQNRPVEKFIEVATAGNIYEVNRAIEFGIEIDAIGACGHNALMAAAYYGHRSIIKVLLAAGADPNLLSDGYDGLGFGMTALMFAASSFFASDRHLVAKQLVTAGADVNQQGAGGKTAMMCAALAGVGYRTCVETLISAGADLDVRDDRGHTVLTLVAAAENYQMFNLLLQAGASTEGLESIQLIQAATIGNLDRVQSLLSTRVNLDLDRGAAIGNAAAAGHTQVVDLLIRAGAHVNLSNNSGFTPISSAAHAGYLEIVRLLIAAGADIQAPAGSVNSYSALEYAQMGMYQFVGAAQKDDRDDRQHGEIVRMLEQLEAR